MGTRRAGLHIRYYSDSEDAEYAENILKLIDDSVRGHDREMLDMVFAIAGVRKSDFKLPQHPKNEEKPVVIYGDKFLSIYWYDVIRDDNIQTLAEQLTEKLKVLVLGAYLFDGDSVALAARAMTESGRIKHADGEYYFGVSITPISCIKLCDILDTPELVGSFREAFEAQDSEEMVELLGTKTGIFIDGYEAVWNGDGIEKIEETDHVEIYRLKKS